MLYTASLVGMHAVYLRHVSDDQFAVKRNNSTLLTQVSSGEERSGVFWLESGDELTANTSGSAATADMAVAWLGDGLV